MRRGRGRLLSCLSALQAAAVPRGLGRSHRASRNTEIQSENTLTAILLFSITCQVTTAHRKNHVLAQCFWCDPFPKAKQRSFLFSLSHTGNKLKQPDYHSAPTQVIINKVSLEVDPRSKIKRDQVERKHPFTFISIGQLTLMIKILCCFFSDFNSSRISQLKPQAIN